jgi:hypothetical protein
MQHGCHAANAVDPPVSHLSYRYGCEILANPDSFTRSKAGAQESSQDSGFRLFAALRPERRQ